jgi:Na+-translocating ferredoxin:NAD+ oxidoreductase RnfE subunit
LSVDLLLLGGLYALMLSSRRYWPIWMVGFHLIAVVTHLTTMLTPSFTPQLYRAMGAFWAIPVLFSLLIGVELDRRALARSRAAEGIRHEP